MKKGNFANIAKWPMYFPSTWETCDEFLDNWYTCEHHFSKAYCVISTSMSVRVTSGPCYTNNNLLLPQKYIYYTQKRHGWDAKNKYYVFRKHKKSINHCHNKNKYCLLCDMFRVELWELGLKVNVGFSF
jgi:hypothetical protein